MNGGRAQHALDLSPFSSHILTRNRKLGFFAVFSMDLSNRRLRALVLIVLLSFPAFLPEKSFFLAEIRNFWPFPVSD
jgi:hypothetical protein